MQSPTGDRDSVGAVNAKQMMLSVPARGREGGTTGLDVVGTIGGQLFLEVLGKKAVHNLGCSTR